MAALGETPTELLLADSSESHVHAAAVHPIVGPPAFETTQLQASTDSLTGLANRRSAEQMLNRLIALGRPFTLVLADLDHFKLLNDTYGHEMGDRWLRQFATVAVGSIRAADMAGRWGGEEFVFVFVFPDSTVDMATGLCERIRSDLVLAAAAANLPNITASFGVVASSAAPVLDELLVIADQALYGAKVAGRDQISIGGK